MSEAKTVTTAGLGLGSIILPIIGTAALAAVATAGIAGAAVTGIALATRGSLRLGQKAYEKIDDHCRKKIEEDMKRQQQRFAQYQRMSQQSSDHTISVEDERPTPEHQLIQSVEVEEQRLDEIIGKVDALKTARQKWEKKHELETTVSADLEKAIKKFEEQKEAIRRRKKEILKQAASDFEKKQQSAAALADQVFIYYPDKVRVIRLRLDAALDRRQPLNEDELDYIIFNLNDMLSNGHKYGDRLARLAELYIFYHEYCFGNFYEDDEKKAFDGRFDKLRGYVEQNALEDADFEKKLTQLKSLSNTHMALAKRRDADARLVNSRDIIIGAMGRLGYLKYTEKENNGFCDLEFFKERKDGKAKKTCIRLKGPDAVEEVGHDFFMVVDPDTFDTEAACQEEGRAIARGIMSTGLQIECEEIELKIAQMFKQKHGIDTKVRFRSLDTIEIAGKRIKGDITTSPKQWISKIESYFKKAGTLGTKQKKRIKERV